MRVQARKLAAALLLAASTLSCEMFPKGEVWSFKCTREFCRAIEYGDSIHYTPTESSESEMDAGPCLLLFVCLPVAFDLVVLPVTAVHDTFVIAD